MSLHSGIPLIVRTSRYFATLLLIFIATQYPVQLLAQQDQQSVIQTHVRQLEGLKYAEDAEDFESFITLQFTPAYREVIDKDNMYSMLDTISQASASAGDVNVSFISEDIRLSFRGMLNIDIYFHTASSPPYLIDTLYIDTDISADGQPETVSVEPIDWTNLRDRLNEEEKAGFSGTVLIVRNGEILLHEGYGMANRESNTPNGTATIFGIGSTPIDFTRAAILLLRDKGELRVGDSITRFFGNVPSDKITITIEHLMTGRSGFPNFHHDPDQDEDYDLTWITRKEALKRIFASPLLFTPGEGQEHSHSAFVLLAAVVEVVSG